MPSVATCPIVENNEPCGRPARKRGMCRKHYMRWYRHGDPLYVPKLGYSAMHQRLRRVRGSASDYACFLCGKSAEDWGCMRNKTETGINSGTPVTFSRNIEDYEPLCKSCNRALDAKRTLTEEFVRDLRMRIKRGEKVNFAALARELGVTKGAVHHAARGINWKHLS